jgi:hypothetical protein
MLLLLSVMGITSYIPKWLFDNCVSEVNIAKFENLGNIISFIIEHYISDRNAKTGVFK